MEKIRKKLKLLIGFLLVSVLVTSCKTQKLLPLPPCDVTYNVYEYHIQSMDNESKCDNSSLTAMYDGFNIRYQLNSYKQLTFVIENNSNKSLILDKSKCYVLYDGYSKELFKDVRSSRVTTFNDVQDAISNVSVNTSEGGITLSIPPYSKWELPINETNIEVVADPNMFVEEYRSLTPYTTNQTIEFVLPYSWDYKLAKWSTSRNRLYIGNIRVEHKTVPTPEYAINKVNANSYSVVTKCDMDEYKRVSSMNSKISEKNSKAKNARYQLRMWGFSLGIAGAALIPALILCLI